MPACTHGSKHMGKGNQFMGMVKLIKGEIAELKLGIDSANEYAIENDG